MKWRPSVAAEWPTVTN